MAALLSKATSAPVISDTASVLGARWITRGRPDVRDAGSVYATAFAYDAFAQPMVNANFNPATGVAINLAAKSAVFVGIERLMDMFVFGGASGPLLNQFIVTGAALLASDNVVRPMVFRTTGNVHTPGPIMAKAAATPLQPQ